MSEIFCLLDDKKASGLRTYYKLDEPFFKKMNDKFFGVYFAVNSFEATDEEMKKNGKKTKRNTQFLKKLRCVFADLDIAKSGDGQTVEQKTEKKIKLLNKIKEKCQPTKIIETANGLQPLWKLKPCGVDESTQKKYVNVINGIIEWSKTVGAAGDAVKDCCRILRLPNYHHHKKEPFLVEVIDESKNDYSLDDLAKLFPFEPEPEYQPSKQNFKLNDTAMALDRLDFQEVIKKALGSVGRSAEFDKKNRLILDGRLTGNFQGKNGDNQFMGSTSHEDLSGNKITIVAKILACTNTEAYAWIVEEFDLKKIVAKKNIEEKLQPPEKKEQKKYYSWGTENLTNNFAPIKRNSYVVVVGETWGGKTAYTFDMAIKNAKMGHRVLYLSLELETDEIFDGIAKSFAGITIKEELHGVPTFKKTVYDKKLKELKTIPNFIPLGVRRGEDVCFEDIKQIINQQKDLDLIFIDNLDLISGDDRDTEYLRQRKISKAIMSFTSEKQIPIVLVHHFRKSSNESDKKVRSLDSISGAAKITHDADRIVQTQRTIDKEATHQEKAELRVFLQKARGNYNSAFEVIYFNKGTFQDKYIPPNQNKKEIVEMNFDEII